MDQILLLVHVSLDAPRCNSINSDALMSTVDRKAASEALYSRLATSVQSVVGNSRHLCGNRGHENDSATMLKVHVRVLRDEELSTSVEIEDAIIVLLGNLVFRFEYLRPRVGHDDVKASKVGDGFFEESGHFSNFGHVGFDGECFAPCPFDLFHEGESSFRGVGVVDNDGSTALSQFEGNTTTNPTAGASDKCDFSVEWAALVAI